MRFSMNTKEEEEEKGDLFKREKSWKNRAHSPLTPPNKFESPGDKFGGEAGE